MDLLLQRGEMLVFPGRRRAWQLRCVSGRVWVTRERDSRDHLLAADRSLELRGRGRIVVTVLADAVLRLEPAGRYRFHLAGSSHRSWT